MSDLDKFSASCLFEIEKCDSLDKLNDIKKIAFGKNGKITEALKGLKDVSEDERKELGAKINNVKSEILRHLEEKFSELALKGMNEKLRSEFVDVSMPPRPSSFGKIHPLTKVAEEVAEIFASYGFLFADGPDIDDEFNNFTAVNIPEHHPARTMHDTFFVNLPATEAGRKLLRTHTTSVDNRTMKMLGAPVKFFSIGRVFRSDYDATHTPMFNQIEGVMVDEDVNFAQLKWIMSDFLKKFFNIKSVKLRLRPSFFPFTEPSAEVDVNYAIEKGRIVLGKGNKWLEICGSGMLHPNVLEYADVDSKKYQALAFGFGLERLASLKYGIPDLRGYFESDERWRDVFGFNSFER